jgi:hypothetical protein
MQAVFCEELLPQFLTVLLRALVERSHQLLQEEVLGALYSMASVDLVAFHERFLPGFLGTTPGLDDSQRSALARNFKMEPVSGHFGSTYKWIYDGHSLFYRHVIHIS